MAYQLIINGARFLWPIIAAVTIAILTTLGWYYKKVKGKSLVVLGMKGAGKTRFYRFLQNKPYIESETEVEEYEEFVYRKKNE